MIVAGATVDACGITAVACIQTLAGILAVAGGPPVIGFPAVEGVLAVTSIPAHPGVPILASRFTYWTLQCDILEDYQTIGLLLSDCYFVLLSDYRNNEYRIGKFKKLSDYRILDLGLNLSEYLILDSEKPAVAHLCIPDSKVELQKSLEWSYIYLCLASHHYLLYFVRLVH